MSHCTQARGSSHHRVNRLQTECAGCDAGVVVDTGARIAEAADGRRRRLTYVDTDIAVWDCPACEHPNADEVH